MSGELETIANAIDNRNKRYMDSETRSRYLDYCLNYWAAAHGGNEHGLTIAHIRLEEMKWMLQHFGIEIQDNFSRNTIMRNGEIRHYQKKISEAHSSTEYARNKLKELEKENMTNQERVDALSPDAREIFQVLDNAIADWLERSDKEKLLKEQDIVAGIELLRHKMIDSFDIAYEEERETAKDN